METLHKIEEIIENAIHDFSSKWTSHIEKDSGITEYAYEITNIIETETAQLQADKAELLEVLEFSLNRLKSTTEYSVVVNFYKDGCDKIESLIKKHKQ